MRLCRKSKTNQVISMPVEKQLSSEVLTHLHWAVDRIEDDYQSLMNRAATLLGFSVVEIGFLVQGYKYFDRQNLECSCFVLFIAISFFFGVLWTRKSSMTIGDAYRILILQSKNQQTFTIAQHILKFDVNSTSLIDDGLYSLNCRGRLLQFGLGFLVASQILIIFTIHRGL